MSWTLVVPHGCKLLTSASGSRTASQEWIDRERLAIGLERALFVAGLAQDNAEVAQRLVVARVGFERIVEVGRACGTLLPFLEIDEPPLMPAFGGIRRELHDGIQHLHGEIEIGAEDESVDVRHQKIDGSAA